MPIYRAVAILLIIAGTLGLVYGGFNYTRETHEAELGPLSLSVADTEQVNVPVWAGIAGIAIGAALLLLRRQS